MKRTAATFSERYSVEDIEAAGRILERDCQTIPPEVIRFMVSAGKVELQARKGTFN